MIAGGVVHERSDEDLLAAIADGPGSLPEFYWRHVAKVTGVGVRRFGTPEDVADFVANVFLEVMQSAGGYDPRRGSARGWLYAVVRNRALSIHRDEHRYEASDEGAQDLDCEATLSRMPETSALRRCLEQIDRPRRDVVVLAYVHGMSHGELAGRLEVPLGTVKSWVRRSLFALQECMG